MQNQHKINVLSMNIFFYSCRDNFNVNAYFTDKLIMWNYITEFSEK